MAKQTIRLLNSEGELVKEGEDAAFTAFNEGTKPEVLIWGSRVFKYLKATSPIDTQTGERDMVYAYREVFSYTLTQAPFN